MKINKKTKSNQKEAAIRFVLIFLALIPIIYIFYSMSTQIAARMAEELTLSYTADSPIYWTVGRGMLQDFKPYEDFYETKPPGIFLLSALSFRLFDSAILSNILCFLCLIVIGVTPLLAVICDLRKKTVPVLNRLTLILSAVLFGGMLMLYTQNRSGSAQVESFGAAFGCIYLFLISRMDGQTTKLRSPILWISSLFLMFSVMMKEPFVLVCCAAALLFINTWKDLLKKLILPLFAGGAAGVLLMLFTGTLIPYLQYHLPNMTGSHVGRYGSPITRGFDFKNILNDINIFSPGLMIALLILAGVVFLLVCFQQLRSSQKASLASGFVQIYHVAKLFLIAYVLVFSVALGGQYYNHHYIFAVPIYMALFLYCIQNFRFSLTLGKNTVSLTAVLLCVCISCGAGAVMLPEYERSDTNTPQDLIEMHAQADYVDALLDAAQVDRYQYLGFNGNVFYCFTEHMPLGPSFIQDSYNYTDLDSWFSSSLKEQLDQSQIVIVSKIDAGLMNDYIIDYLDKNFSQTPWDEVKDLPPPYYFFDDIYFRNR